ncbi:MAG TPA: efflux RND transporter periplasmic adaptor subunit [Candidatus Paceibacterota bacterium]|nr:efflux RND transporter periplasmic adaptor subunit [Candidatus Paceibacterota bacterium]
MDWRGSFGFNFNFIFSGSKGSGKYDYTKAKKGDIRQEVSVTGDVRPIEGVDLAFEKSGRVSRVNVKAGDEVYRGQPLVSLGSNDLYAQLEEAKASLKAEEAKLRELKRGPTSYEVDVKESEIKEAEQDLVNKYADVVTYIEDAYAQADDAVRAKTTELFQKSSGSYVLDYDACDSGEENQANFVRNNMEDLLMEWREEIKSFDDISNVKLLDALDEAQENLSLVTNFLNEVNDTLVVDCELSDSDVSSYRTKVSTARDNVNSILSSLNSLEQSIALKTATLSRKQSELNQLLAGATEEKVSVQEATVDKMTANVGNIRAQIEKGILRAPFSGVITKVDAEIGEIVDAYKEVVSVVSDSGFKIEVNIPEVDVSKVEVGDKAEVTLDAYGEDETFEAELISVDSSETEIEGVSTYGATLEFVESDKRIKSGMTANVDIITGVREDVVYVPQRAVINEESKDYVRILDQNDEVVKKEVEIGLKGSLGNVEIKKGVSVGDRVIVFIEE